MTPSSQPPTDPPIDPATDVGPIGSSPTARSSLAFTFDDPPHRRRRRRRRGVVVGAAVAAAVLLGGTVLGVQASSADPRAQLRTATVQTRSVAQTIDTVASVEPVAQASIAFPVSGTVATVDVATGDVVTTGQVLATLDTTSLQATVHERQADLANAQLSLQQALNGETVTGTGASEGAPAGGAASAGSSVAGSSGAATAATATPSSSSTATSSSSTATAAELIAYQKAVAAAAVGLLAAEQAVEQATIVSPIDGTVVSLDLAIGDDVTAASSTATVVVAGAGGFELTTTVSVTDLPDIEIGQAVVVRPDASADELTGSIVAVGVTPIASSPTSYAVTIAINGDTTGLRNGSTASVSIVTSDEVDALAVPSSAVTTDGDRHTVRVVDAAGQTADVNVEVGAVGGAWIAVTDGLDLGQTVVLANLDDALPGSATDATAATTSRGSFGGPPTGAFPGGPAGMGARPGG